MPGTLPGPCTGDIRRFRHVLQLVPLLTPCRFSPSSATTASLRRTHPGAVPGSTIYNMVSRRLSPLNNPAALLAQATALALSASPAGRLYVCTSLTLCRCSSSPCAGNIWQSSHVRSFTRLTPSAVSHPLPLLPLRRQHPAVPPCSYTCMSLVFCCCRCSSCTGLLSPYQVLWSTHLVQSVCLSPSAIPHPLPSRTLC